MTVLKCKMCGGALELTPGVTVAECPYCGTKQTVPNLDDDQKAQLYERANKLRRANEFDKAFAVYESIIASFPDDAEAYWGELLCKYGIEYVDDPATGMKIPTCHRSSFTSILEDEAFEMVMENGDPASMQVYRQEAKQIEEIRKGVLEISSKEPPYDIFICYKETDDNGNRTIDSVIAQDAYNALVKEGYRVFFSRISLEDKLGKEYEPYIFAALNSAKVMLVFGTKYEYFNAVWVKNEWSRYLHLISKGVDKTLIPCYKNIDAYDMPKEFQRLQSQDMGKIGATQDLVRGINKIIRPEKPKASDAIEMNSKLFYGDANTLMKRAFIFLEDGEWDKADEFCEQVLNADPENAQAYLGKLMAENHVSKLAELRNCKTPFDKNNNFQKILRYGNDKLKKELSEAIDLINERNEQERLAQTYEKSVHTLKCSKSESEYKIAMELFQSIRGYKDSDQLAARCLEYAETARKNQIYDDAVSLTKKNTIIDYETAIQQLQTISNWKDSEKLVDECKKGISTIKETERKAARIRKISLSVVCLLIISGIAFYVYRVNIIVPKQQYKEALSLINSGKYEEAYTILQMLGKSDEIINNKRERAQSLIKDNKYDEAYSLLEEISDLEAIKRNEYERAKQYLDQSDYWNAYVLLNELDYSDSNNLIEKMMSDPEIMDTIIQKKETTELMNAEIGSIVSFGSYDLDSNSENGLEPIKWKVLDRVGNQLLLISQYEICKMHFNEVKNTNSSWETCSLRSWLNHEFYDNAFKSYEQERINTSSVNADKGYEYNQTSQGNSTKDKVFILSYNEVNKYFGSPIARMLKPYSLDEADNNNSSFENSFWWLRTIGSDSDRTMFVLKNGEVNVGGDIQYSVMNSVRPSIWVTVSE